ncbi:MAG: neutral/alkaline non-lysosomal ceramidase N-terminal domain-containing protein [Acidobacteriota bacterium]
MKVGASKTKITPPIGFPLSGYRARVGVSCCVHDDLYSRAIAFEGSDDEAILISVDVLALSAQFTSEVRRRISSLTSVQDGKIVIAATHTHSGPHTIQTFFNADLALNADYMAQLASAIAQSGFNAWERRTSAKVGVSSCQVADVGTNRRNPAQGVVDREAAIIRADHPDGSPMAVAVVYGCHPTVLGVGNLQITGDFPASTIEALEKQLGTNTFALFFNGAEGDISIGHSARLSAIGAQTPGRTFEHASELGERLAVAVLAAFPAIQTSDATVIKVAQQEVCLDGANFPSVSELQKAAKDASERAKRAAADHGSTHSAPDVMVEEVYAEARYNNARQLEKLGNIIPMTMNGVRIGETLFLSIPGEVFAETGLAIKANVYRHAFVIGLANGYFGYLPIPSAYQEGGYEVEVALCAPESEQRLMEAAGQLKGVLFPELTRNAQEDK